MLGSLDRQKRGRAGVRVQQAADNEFYDNFFLRFARCRRNELERAEQTALLVGIPAIVSSIRGGTWTENKSLLNLSSAQSGPEMWYSNPRRPQSATADGSLNYSYTFNKIYLQNEKNIYINKWNISIVNNCRSHEFGIHLGIWKKKSDGNAIARKSKQTRGAKWRRRKKRRRRATWAGFDAWGMRVRLIR